LSHKVRSMHDEVDAAENLRVIRKLMERAKVEPLLISFTCNMAYAMLMVFVVIGVLERLGVPTTSAVAIIGAAGLAVGLDGEMERIWTTHFKGDTYTLPDFFDGIDSGTGKENTAAGLQLAALRNDSGMDVSLEPVLAKLALSLKQGGILALQWKNPRLDENMETVAGRYGLKLQDREKYWSLALQYDWNPMYIFAKQ